MLEKSDAHIFRSCKYKKKFGGKEIIQIISDEKNLSKRGRAHECMTETFDEYKSAFFIFFFFLFRTVFLFHFSLTLTHFLSSRTDSMYGTLRNPYRIHEPETLTIDGGTAGLFHYVTLHVIPPSAGCNNFF